MIALGNKEIAMWFYINWTENGMRGSTVIWARDIHAARIAFARQRRYATIERITR
jgi:hypothetical protein